MFLKVSPTLSEGESCWTDARAREGTRVKAFVLGANENKKWSIPKALRLRLVEDKDSHIKDLMRTSNVLRGGGYKTPLGWTPTLGRADT